MRSAMTDAMADSLAAMHAEHLAGARRAVRLLGEATGAQQAQMHFDRGLSDLDAASDILATLADAGRLVIVTVLADSADGLGLMLATAANACMARVWA